MSTGAAILARATSDGADRLVSADEPLAGLQLRCGGDVPGTIAVPALLETVRKSRRYELSPFMGWTVSSPRRPGRRNCGPRSR